MAFGMSASQVGLLGVGANLLGSSMQSSGADGAARAQQQGTDAAIAEQRRQFDQTQANNAPFLRTGTSANQKLAALLGLGPKTYAASSPMSETQFFQSHGPYDGLEAAHAAYDSYVAGHPATEAADYTNDYGSLNNKFSIADFNNDPVIQLGYQSGLDLGTRAINNKAAANGGRDNGAVLKALTKFGTDYTGQQAGASRDRFVQDQGNIYNRLAGLSGTGQTAVATNASAGANSAGNISGLLSAQGNANAGASIARGNAWQGGLQNIGNFYNQQTTLDKLIAARQQPQSTTPNYAGNINPYTYEYNYG